MADTLPTTAPAPAAPAPPSYAHPMAAFFLFFFKAAAIFIYIFCGWFGTDFVINFCLITFLLVCDFWTVRVWAGGAMWVLRAIDSALPAAAATAVGLLRRGARRPLPLRLSLTAARSSPRACALCRSRT